MDVSRRRTAKKFNNHGHRPCSAHYVSQAGNAGNPGVFHEARASMSQAETQQPRAFSREFEVST